MNGNVLTFTVSFVTKSLQNCLFGSSQTLKCIRNKYHLENYDIGKFNFVDIENLSSGSVIKITAKPIILFICLYIQTFNSQSV